MMGTLVRPAHECCCACIQPATWQYTGTKFDGDYLCDRHATLVRGGVDNDPNNWRRLEEAE